MNFVMQVRSPNRLDSTLSRSACLWAYLGDMAAAADYPCPSNVEVKTAWSYISTPLHGVLINDAQIASPSYTCGYSELQFLSECD
jgi:hypothetical protein